MLRVSQLLCFIPFTTVASLTPQPTAGRWFEAHHTEPQIDFKIIHHWPSYCYLPTSRLDASTILQFSYRYKGLKSKSLHEWSLSHQLWICTAVCYHIIVYYSICLIYLPSLLYASVFILTAHPILGAGKKSQQNLAWFHCNQYLICCIYCILDFLMFDGNSQTPLIPTQTKMSLWRCIMNRSNLLNTQSSYTILLLNIGVPI